MKGITSTTFGLLIAFLLPGLVALIALSYWVPLLQVTFNTFLTTDANLGLAILVLLIAVVVSLQLTLVRWLLFEVLLCRPYRLKPQDFQNLGTEGKLLAFRGAVEEHYRYHQFWGSMSIVIPIFYLGWAREMGAFPITGKSLLILALFLFMEGVTVAGAVIAYRNYVERAKQIMN